MRIAVTGKNGQVARSLETLAQENPHFEVVTLGRPELDLAHPHAARAVLSAAAPDIVVSAAAYTAVDQAEDEPETAYAVNASGAEAVAQVAEGLGVPLIHLSTDYVYDGTKDAPYVEDDVANPRSVYGETKLQGEKLVAAAHSSPIIIRTAWVYSPYGKNFPKTMLALAQNRDEIGVVSDQSGSPTSALEIARAIQAVAHKIVHDGGREFAGIYHFAGSGYASWHAFAEYVFDSSRRYGGPSAKVKPISTAQFPTKARRPQSSQLDCGRFRSTFGYEAPDWRHSVDEVVSELVRS
ncbi:dTDP-4-dehydrorhamnose reductase [Nitratireductor aquimarinus]|uniref:dTDP-4-dehydrorhamnose reductase n=1 Tax=Nitratireductor aquimarinus TaxID=889300 RepID=UPI003B5A7FCF